MLVLQRSINERLTVRTPAGDYVVTVTDVKGSRVWLGIEAPREWPIERDDMRRGESLPQAASAATPPSASINSGRS